MLSFLKKNDMIFIKLSILLILYFLSHVNCKVPYTPLDIFFFRDETWFKQIKIKSNLFKKTANYG
jgi:hypothetical protein